MTIESSNRNLIPQKCLEICLPSGQRFNLFLHCWAFCCQYKIYRNAFTGAKKACVRGGSWEVSLINLEFTAWGSGRERPSQKKQFNYFLYARTQRIKRAYVCACALKSCCARSDGNARNNNRRRQQQRTRWAQCSWLLRGHSAHRLITERAHKFSWFSMATPSRDPHKCPRQTCVMRECEQPSV